MTDAGTHRVFVETNTASGFLTSNCSRPCPSVQCRSQWREIAPLVGMPMNTRSRTSLLPLLLVFAAAILCNHGAVSQDLASPLPPPPMASCVEGKFFKTLHNCTQTCRGDNSTRTTFYENHTDTDTEYRLVILSEGEFSDANDTLRTQLLPMEHFPSHLYWLANDSAYVCYPMSAEYSRCESFGKLYPTDDDVTLSADNRMLTIKDHVYDLSNFLVNLKRGNVKVCIPTPDPAAKFFHYVLKVGCSVSSICLLLTFVLSLAIPELKMKQNKVLLGHLAMLWTAFVTMFVKLFSPETSEEACIVTAIIQQYCFLSAFCWINAQAFDLCYKLSQMRMPQISLSTGRRTFFYYCIYAWGAPLVICALTLAAQLTLTRDSVFFPDFGNYTCWFRDQPLAIYFYGPIAIILCANIVLFIVTVTNLFRTGQDAAAVHTSIHKQLLRLYLKLVVVMGLCWTMEVVSWAVGGPAYYWYFTDSINAFQGFFIFLIYLCKESNFSVIYEKMRPDVWWHKTIAPRPSVCSSTLSTTPPQVKKEELGLSNVAFTA